MIQAIIIDDDPQVRKALKSMIIQANKGLEICAEASGVEDGIRLINEYKPDLLFLDIRLKGGTGFDILKNLQITSPAVIFTTAYSEFAIKAIKYAALDYLLKPIDPIELEDAIDKYLNSRNENVDSRLEVLETFMASSIPDKRKIVLTDASGFQIIPLDDIVFCMGEKNYTTFYLVNGKEIVTSKSLIEYEKLLDEEMFMRVHKSYIVRLKYVEAFKKGRDSKAVMKGGATVSISREKKEVFLNLLSKILK